MIAVDKQSKVADGALQPGRWGCFAGSSLSESPATWMVTDIIAALRSGDIEHFLKASREFMFLKRGSLAMTDPDLSNFLNSTCQILGDWGSFENQDERPVELARRLRLIDGLLDNPRYTQNRQNFLIDHRLDFEYFREVTPACTPAGWLKPITDLDSVVVGQLRGYVEILRESLSSESLIVRWRIPEEVKRYLSRSYFSYFGSIIQSLTPPKSRLAELMSDIHSIIGDHDITESDILKMEGLINGLDKRKGIRNDPRILCREFNLSSETQALQVKAIADTLCTDPSIPKPQKGFGVRFSLEDIRKMLSNRSARLHMIAWEGKETLFYHLYTNFLLVPFEFRDIVQLIHKHKLDFRMPCAFVNLEGALKDERRIAAQELGEPLSTLQTKAARHSLRVAGVMKAFLIVRQDNLAKLCHAREGWQDTGLTVSPYGNGKLYNIMSLEV